MRGSDCTLTRAIGFPREKCLTGTFLLFIGLPSIYRLRFTLLVLVTLVLSGCLRVISVDYVPLTPTGDKEASLLAPSSIPPHKRKDRASSHRIESARHGTILFIERRR